jgi:hypothetical protein
MSDEHPHTHTIPPGEEPGWLDKWENVQKLLKGFFAACALLLAVDVFALVGWYDKHPHFLWEKIPGFYGFYGLGACVALVLMAKQLRKVVMRPEGYYEDVADAEERGDA